MKQKIDITNTDQMVSTANEIFEGVEITEEDFTDQFDKHLASKDIPMDLKTNREVFLELGEQCNRYDPCPICFKCRNKGSHLYTKCDSCPIPLCVHTHANRNMLIRRENFTQECGQALADILKDLEHKNCSND